MTNKAIDAMLAEAERQGFYFEEWQGGRDGWTDTVKARLVPIGADWLRGFKAPPVDANAIARAMAEESGRRTSVTIEVVAYGDSEWGSDD